jgi:hypothetical protein
MDYNEINRCSIVCMSRTAPDHDDRRFPEVLQYQIYDPNYII